MIKNLQKQKQQKCLFKTEIYKIKKFAFFDIDIWIDNSIVCEYTNVFQILSDLWFNLF